MHAQWGVAPRAPVQGRRSIPGSEGRELRVGHTYAFWVGIDWGNESHQVCVLDSHRERVDERAVPHSGSGLADLVERLVTVSLGNCESLAVAIEVPRGAVVETLVERGFHVFAINPKQLDRFRDRYCTSGAKDDRRDAFVLADALATDLHCFRRVRLDDPRVVGLREIGRLEDDLQQEAGRLTNRLRDQLHRFYTHALRLCPAADEPWFWTLVERAPTPAQGASLQAVDAQEILRAHRIRRLSADEVLCALREPAVRVAPGVVEAASEHVALLLPRLRLMADQRRHCRQRLEQLLDELAEGEPGQISEHRDVQVLRSLPGVGSLVAAAMLGEASQPLAERDYHALRTQSGIAPVTQASGKRSGKRAHVVMRRGCNPRLRDAMFHWARVSTQHDARSRLQYAALRARGHSHGRALRGVADALLRMLVAMLRRRELYDASRRLVQATRSEQGAAHG